MHHRPTSEREPLAAPLPQHQHEAFFDCVVVGSGFGGAVMAARLSPHLPPGQLAVLERGREFLPGQFPETWNDAVREVRTPTDPLGLYDLTFSDDMDTLVGNALGGTSTIYANVTEEPLPEVFDSRIDSSDPTSPRRWPSGMTYAALRPYFSRVRDMLAVEKYLDAEDTESAGGERDYRGRTADQRAPLPRTSLLRERAGSAFIKVPLAVNVTRHDNGERNAFGVRQSKCTLCGNCVTGCNVGAKNSLDTNYLPLARQHGARMLTHSEVTHLVPSTQNGYRYCLHTIRRELRGGKVVERHMRVHTRMAVLSAGVFGTVGILLNSARRAQMRFSARLGAHFSANADACVINYDTNIQVDAIGRKPKEEGSARDVGPTITSMADTRRGAEGGSVVEDGAIPAALRNGLGPVLARRFVGTEDRRTQRKLWLSGQRSASHHAQVWLRMGYDTAGGRLWLDKHDRVRVRWSEARAQQRQQRPVTVHPLGGCVMADDVEHGVIDDAGRVRHQDGGVYPGLYVADASACNGSLGTNPSLTIAALAERAAERIIAEDVDEVLDR